MKSLAALIISLLNLLEAEGVLFRENFLVVLRRSLIMLLGIGFAGCGLAFLTAACYDSLLLVLPKPLVLALTALMCALIAFFLLRSVKICPEKPKSRINSGQAEEKKQPSR